MVQRTSRGIPVEIGLRECTVCKATDKLIHIEITNTFTTLYAGYFCDWNEYLVWKKTFDVERKALLVGQEDLG